MPEPPVYVQDADFTLLNCDVPETTFAYLAGLVDGEGYVGIKKSNRKPNPVYHERIQIRMVHEEAIALLAETLGGNYYREQPHADGGRPLYCYQASDRKAADIALALLPYLRVKRLSALNLLELRASKRDPRARLRGGPTGRHMPPDITAERERIYLRAKALNARGGDA